MEIHDIVYLGRRNRPRGVPNERMTQDNRAIKMPQSLIPETPAAVRMYHLSGGSLSPPGVFGVDPLALDSEKGKIRHEVLVSTFPLEHIFTSAVNGDEKPFKEAFKFFVDVTERLSRTLSLS